VTAPRTLLGDSEVLHAIKSGGMGDVLLARRRGAGGFEQLCAIKTIRGDLAAAPLARAMFLDEARLLARLTHPAIAQILGFGEQDGTLYMMMEYVPGEHFRRFGERRPPPAIVCVAMAAACRGLHAAHELRDLGDGHLLGVVHRDIAPDNLMLGFDARVKVLDFGIALVKGRQAPVTEFGVLKGKPPYMSPEQVKNEALDRRSDVFSACVVLHELLAGRPLFEGDSLYAIARAVEHQELRPPSVWAGTLPPDLDDVVMAGLERDRDRRLGSAAALAEVLERIAAGYARESLEAWTERELAAAREQHRGWLARILAASGPMKAAVGVGRPTGMVTAVGETAEENREQATGNREPGTEENREQATGNREQGTEENREQATGNREQGTEENGKRETGNGKRETGNAAASERNDAAWREELGSRATVAMDAAAEPGVASTTDVFERRRRGRVLAVIIVLLLLVGALAVFVLGIGRERSASPIDAMVVAPVDALVVPVYDAAAIDAVMVDASDERDAGRSKKRDAGAPIDAAPASTPPIDAAPKVTGTGFLTCTADPFANVSIDGGDWGPTPFFKKPIDAGRHQIVFTSPQNGAIVKRTTIDIAPGQSVTVRVP
jgi:eukaryotic-like serine/threonine-protein kinase